MPALTRGDRAGLVLVNRSAQKIVLSEVRLQNYRGINREMPPKLVVLLESPPQQMTGWLWLVTALVLGGQVVAACFAGKGSSRAGWATGAFGFWRVCPWPAWGRPPVGRLFGLYLTLPWDTFLGAEPGWGPWR